jgi:hypothetical protein
MIHHLLAIIKAVVYTAKVLLKLVMSAIFAKHAETLKTNSDLNLSLANAQNELVQLKIENLKLKQRLTRPPRRRKQ